jgi:hypothetical protein
MDKKCIACTTVVMLVEKALTSATAETKIEAAVRHFCSGKLIQIVFVSPFFSRYKQMRKQFVLNLERL